LTLGGGLTCVEVLFDDEELRDDCNDEKALIRRFNRQRAKLVRRRLDDLHAAPNLETMRNLPGRCHELKGDRKGQVSIDLDGPYRMILRPLGNPMPRKQDGGLSWRDVKAISIVEIIDTHE
jgi:plasmid maintenance system killer protein